MGSIYYDAVIVTTVDFRPGGLPDLDAFRASLPDGFRQLVIGPVPSVVNSRVSYAFLPDGSKTGWDTSALAGQFRAEFVGLFGSDHDDVVLLTYGWDHLGDFDEPVARYADSGGEP